MLFCISWGRSGERGIVPSSSCRQRCGSASRDWATGCSEAGTPIQSFMVLAAALSTFASERKGSPLLSRSMLKLIGSLFFGRRERMRRPSFREASNVSKSLIRTDIAARSRCRSRPCMCDRRSEIFLLMSWCRKSLIVRPRGNKWLWGCGVAGTSYRVRFVRHSRRM